MARIEDLLSPDEQVVMDSPAVDDKGLLRRLPGTLYLTTVNLIFAPAKPGFLQGAARREYYSDVRAPDVAIKIPLASIQTMDAEANKLIIYAQERHVFSDVPGSYEWMMAIKEAKNTLMPAPAPPAAPPAPPAAPPAPPPAPPARRPSPELPEASDATAETRPLNYCPYCGTKVSRGARFCTYCGSKLVP